MEERPIEEELQELVAAVREHVTWHKRLGAWGLPASPEAPPMAAPEKQAAAGPARESGERLEMPKFELPARAPAPAPAQAPAPRAPQFEVPDDPAERIARLDALCARVQACTACPLHEKRTQTAFSRGNPRAEILFVGEGPGAEEDAQGVPFVGKAGQLLDKMITAMGFDPSEVYICNVVKCRPPDNRTPEPEEMAACAAYMHEQIALVAPKVMVALGGTATRGLLGTTEGITRLRGKWKLYRASIPVMPTFHPAYLLRNDAAKRDVWADLKSVLQQIGRTVPERKR